MTDKKEKKKPIFEKVGLVFRSPIRADILRKLSEKPQKPIEMAESIGIQKQNLNYHLNALKRGGLIQTHTEKIPEPELKVEKGVRINGQADNGKIQVSYGVELTKNGKEVLNQFISPLYEEDTAKNKKKNEKFVHEDE